MAIVTVLGAGRMGTALCTPLLDRGHEVRLVGTHLDDAFIDALRATGIHPGLGRPLPPGASFHHVGSLPAALAGADGVVLGVSSAGARWAGRTLSSLLRPATPVLMITKGIEWDGSSFVSMPDAFASELSPRLRDTIRPVSISGPCLAGELVRRVETCVVFAGSDGAETARWAGLLRTPYYHAWTSADLAGHQAAAAFKNAYVLGVGFGAGLHAREIGFDPDAPAGAAPRESDVALQSLAMHNHRAAVFAQAAVELRLLVQIAGGEPGLVDGLSGVGDLHVTCHGRNHHLGFLLGAGVPIDDALRRLEGVSLEGLEATRVAAEAIPALERDGRIGGQDLPLLRHLVAVIEGREPVGVPFERFFA